MASEGKGRKGLPPPPALGTTACGALAQDDVPALGHLDRQTDGRTVKQTDRQTDEQTGGHADRQIDIQRVSHGQTDNSIGTRVQT